MTDSATPGTPSTTTDSGAAPKAATPAPAAKSAASGDQSPHVAPAPAPKPTIGRSVHFFLKNPKGEVVCRPAIVVDVHSGDCITCQVFLAPWDRDPGPNAVRDDGMRTSVLRSTEHLPGTWNWMPYQMGQAAKTQEAEAALASLQTAQSSAQAATA